jgi:peptidoglycan/LPS O-acetylase OafA/YrhL
MSEPAGTWLAGKIAFAAVGVFFVAALLLPAVQRHLACGSWQFLGFVSYPLYLVHENMMVALTVKLGHIAPGLPGWALPLLPMTWVIVVAWCIARFAEPALSRAIAWRGRGGALIPAAGR